MGDIKSRVDRYIQDQEYEQAVDVLTDVINREVDVIKSLVLRAEVYILKQEYAKALNDYNKVIKIDPENKTIAAKVEMITDILKFQALDIYSATNLNMDPWLEG